MAPIPMNQRRSWSLRVAGDNLADLEMISANPDRVLVTIHRLVSGANYDIQLNQTTYTVTSDTAYRLTFNARAAAVRPVGVGFSKAGAPWSNLGLYRRLQLSTEWADYSFDFVATEDEDNARIHFDLADANSSVELASVALWKVLESGLIAVDRVERSSGDSPVRAPEKVSADTGKSWISAAANPHCARVLPAFRLFAVLGTWNEADIVSATIRNAIAQGCERVYVVDNFSTDGTVEAATKEGAIIARSYRTERYDEVLRLRHMNDVVSEVSESEGAAHIWWLFLDADEFDHGPWGMTIREYLTTLDQQFRIVGTRFFDHYPSAAPQYESGRHPLDYQPLCEELAYPMCPSRHRKHPLQRYDRGGAPIRCGMGFHDASCEEQLVEPAQPAFLHHFPFRDERITRRRLEALWAVGDTGVSRALETRDTHILTRFRSVDAVYSQQWDKVENFIARDPINRIVNAPAFGVSPKPWSETVEAEHQPVLRWYSTPMIGAWNYRDNEKFRYGDDTSYRKGIAFLDGHGDIEDWGCGFAHARTFVTKSGYVGVDGSSKWADKIVDLCEYTSEADCIFMRHVLEHNLDWKHVLANAVASFRKRMVLVIFTPLIEFTHVIATSTSVTSFPVPDIAFRKEDLTSYFQHLKYSEECLETDTQYGIEHLFYIEK